MNINYRISLRCNINVFMLNRNGLVFLETAKKYFKYSLTKHIDVDFRGQNILELTISNCFSSHDHLVINIPMH